ncbi:MAG: YhcH/YjgK/YiaL family protein [Nitrospirae bacterium]|nr:YhcH/YjgK/YiaL family protein [Nitrospirota bacterium]
MIVTDIRHIAHQISMSSALKMAIDFLQEPDIHDLADGRVNIDGQHVFALVQRYETIIADIPRFEYHRAFMDIQYIVSGEEIIGWAPAGRMVVTELYNSEQDICFGIVPKGEITPVYLQAGQLAILYPEDSHAPKLAAGSPSQVTKIVVKVAV